MKQASAMILGSVLLAGILIAAIGAGTGREILLGMGGPAVVASLEWIAVERTFRRSPEKLTAVMLRTFAGKIVFFGAYVAVILGWDLVTPMPFVISFAGFFLVLLAVEALALQRLTAPPATD